MEASGCNGWLMQVHGKGSKHRLAVVPGQAPAALENYLLARGLGAIGTAPPQPRLAYQSRRKAN